jgi:hypothetical protein
MMMPYDDHGSAIRNLCEKTSPSEEVIQVPPTQLKILLFQYLRRMAEPGRIIQK